MTKRKEKLYQLEVNPVFAIGQRALLVLSEKGNVLWDCIPLLDEATIEFIKSKGGIKAIAFSHPHYYSNMREWAEVFQCPVYIHENDKAHVVDSNQWTTFWSGDEFMLWDGIQIILVGGHFEGSSILRVPFLSAQGTILCGDTLFLSPNKKHFSILRSYPNRIPLPLAEMKRIETRLNEIPFDAFYGYISSQTLEKNVKTVLKESFAKYV